MDSTRTHEWPALSVRQPWAELLLAGRKSIELRSWTTDYRGRLWLHASLKADPAMESRFGYKDLFRGGFVGSIRLIAIVPFTNQRWLQWGERHLDPGGYRTGLLAWIMDEPRRFRTPVIARGQIGLFTPDSNVVRQLKEADCAIAVGGH
jgi:hypothetical protein